VTSPPNNAPVHTNPFAHRLPRKWLKTTITLPKKKSGLLITFLTELTGSGIEESVAQPGTVLPQTSITCYLDNNDKLKANKEKITLFLQENHLNKSNITFEEITEEDWSQNWKKHFKPTRISKRITIKPTWEPYTPDINEIVIEIDPGLAFGTGLHESTRLALQLIESSFTLQTHQNVLDVGTGTGVLAMAAALLGASKVSAIDNDPDAVVCAIDNIKQNKVSSIIGVSAEDLSCTSNIYDLVIANITSDVLTLLASQLVKKMKHNGQLILAGILAGDQAKDIEKTFSELGLTMQQAPVEGEWQGFLFQAKPHA
jgi:ribosomal protein L11 methyltransferase